LETNSDFTIEKTTGWIGIGTNDPKAKLHSELNGEQLRLSVNDNNYATFSVSDSGVLTIQSNCNGFQTEDIIIKTGDFNNAIYIDNGQKGVGIGISPNSDSELHIGGETPQLTIGDGGTEDTSILFNGNQKDFYIALDDIGDTENDFVIGTGSTIGSNLKMVIENGGDVGIATMTPDRKLDILDTSSPQLRLTQSDGTVYTDLQTTSDGNLYLNPSGNKVGIEEDDPVTTLDINGGLATEIISKSSDYTVGPDDYTILVDSTSGVKKITLPEASTCKGRIIVVKRIAGSNNVEIYPAEGDYIDGWDHEHPQWLGGTGLAHTYQAYNNDNWYILADKD
jgi:hypothetical protein